MMQNTIVVTGSSGLIGRAACEMFAGEGFTVLGLDRPGMPHPPRGIETIACDVTSDESVRAAVDQIAQASGGEVAAVIHLAAYYDFSGEPSSLYDEVTVRGTERLLAALQAVRLEQFVFSSTMLVHAPCAPGERIDEQWPLDPKWEYPDSKLRAEQAIRAGRGAAPAVLLRISGVYTDRCESIPLAHQIQRISERRLTASVFPGDVNTGQAYLHLADLLDAFRAAVGRRRQLPPETVLLLGEEDVLSYDQLQRRIAGLVHGEPDWTTTQIPKAVAKAGAWVQDRIPGIEEPFIKPWMIDLADDHYALDTGRARTLLDWRPANRLSRTLPKMIAALRDDPAAWYRDNKLEGVPAPKGAGS